MKKQDLMSLTRKELIKWFENKGFPGFRAKQVFNWIYKNGVKNFDQMKNIPDTLLNELKEKCTISNLILKNVQASTDSTIKYLWSLPDCETIESVFLPFADNRNSVCISTQVGCAMKCRFCATGLSGLTRNLSTGEIIDQVLEIQREISNEEFGKPRISNIVFMGMGEPLANLNSVIKAINIFNDNKGFDIGMRRITVSTSGLVPQIIELADLNIQIVLAISLNAPNDQLRNQLMPINKKYPLKQLLKSATYYTKKTNRRITFEYVLIKDINDSPVLAKETANLIKGILCHVNLIPLNPIKEFNFKMPTKRTVNNFRDILEKNGIETTVRQERGTDIDAACGQLRNFDQ